MSRRSLLLAAVTFACLGAAVVAEAAGSAATYRWVDNQGVVHYGDRVPPQYSQQGSTMLNKEGVVIGHVDASKTAAQLAEEAQAQEVLEKQKQHDSFLLATYTSVKDIEQLRDERLNQIQDQRVAAEQYVAALGARLTALQVRIQNFRPYSSRPDARRMPDDLAEQVVHTLNDIRAQHAALSTSEQEEAATRAQFQSDIDRYEQLRAAQTVTR